MSIIYLNGDYIEGSAPLISHKDSGFTTGIGIFDSMLAQDGALIHEAEHFERIAHDVSIVIGCALSFSFEEFENACLALLQKNNLQTGYVRVRTTVTGGVVSAPLAKATHPTILIDVAPCNAPPNTAVSCAIITDFPRVAGCVLENCKRLDYARSYAARRKAESLGAEEAILINTDGSIACGATSNIFIEENGVRVTPPLRDGILAGVTRRKLIEQGNVREESISPQRLKSADKIYLTNSFIGLREVALID